MVLLRNINTCYTHDTSAVVLTVHLAHEKDEVVFLLYEGKEDR